MKMRTKFRWRGGRKSRGRLLKKAKKTVVATAAIGCGVGIMMSRMSGQPTTEATRITTISNDAGKRVSSFAAAKRAERGRTNVRAATSDRAEPKAAAQAWEQTEVTVPKSVLNHLKIPAFASVDAKSPMLLSTEMKSVLGLDDSTAATVEQILEQAHLEASQNRWNAAQVFRHEQTTVVDVSPEKSETGLQRLAGLRAALTNVLGDQRTAFLFDRAMDTFNWEFGGFGAYSQVIEVIPRRNGYVIRESLRRPLGSAPKGMEKWQAEEFQDFEFAVKEYRADSLPKRIERAMANAA